MTGQKNKKKICRKSKLQAVCTLKATCSISLVCTFIKLARAKCVQMSEWNQTPRSFFHVFSDSRFSTFFSSDSRFSQVCGSRLHARYRLRPGLPIYLASSLPIPPEIRHPHPIQLGGASSLPIQLGGATHNLQVLSLSLHRINADMGL